LNNTKPDLTMYLFLVILYSIQLFFFFISFFTTGLFYEYGFSLGSLSEFSIIGIVCIHGIFLLGLFLLSYGIIKKKIWARKFTTFFLLWSSLWVVWSIFIGNNVLINSFILICYIFLIIYLSTQTVLLYFTQFFLYGKYMLYTRIVKLKSGIILPIYFFSSHKPKSGIPSQFPQDYLIKENLVTTEQLQEALAISKKTNKSVEFVLIDRFKIDKKQVGKSLSLFYGCPFKNFVSIGVLLVLVITVSIITRFIFNHFFQFFRKHLNNFVKINTTIYLNI